MSKRSALTNTPTEESINSKKIKYCQDKQVSRWLTKERKKIYLPNSLFALSFVQLVNTNQLWQIEHFKDLLLHKEPIEIVTTSKWTGCLSLETVDTRNPSLYDETYQIEHAFPRNRYIVIVDEPNKKEKLRSARRRLDFS